MLRPHACAMLLSCALLGSAAGASAQHMGGRLAPTPPMGWNSWNHFGCNVSSQLIRETADAMVASGMKDAGYRYVVIDDCWQVERGADGRIIPDAERFPEGMKALADYVHDRGLLFGIYTDAGRATCEGRPGSYGHEAQDARTYAEWGVDYVKVDWCNSEGLDARERYAVFRDALAASGRDIVFSICEWGTNEPWDWGPATGNLWRTTGDIADRWASVLTIVDRTSQYWRSAGPGHWNDPDMLEVGNGGMTDDEYRAHFSLWAVLAAPLVAGNDLRGLVGADGKSRVAREILTNAEVIAVDQDPLGIQGRLVQNAHPELQVWSKPLVDGARAAVLLNRASVPATVTVDFGRLGIRTDSARVRDLWARRDEGTFAGRYQATVPSHAAVMVRVTPVR